MKKKNYTKEEKIKFYNYLIFDLERKLERARDRLHYIMGPDYQDWNNDLQKQLNEKKKA